jgi:hypothetical protein
MSQASPVFPATTIPQQIEADTRARYDEVVALTDAFCDKYLNHEYREGCRRLAAAVCITGGPIQQGKAASWASGIAYCLGHVNFLTDPSQSPHLRSEDIARGFGVSPATMHGKARNIRNVLDIMNCDPRFTLPSRLEQNPLIWMLQVNGLLVDVRSAPRDAQVAAYEAGLIPYIPADGRPEGLDWLPLIVEESDDTREGPTAREDIIYQLKIMLEGVEPAIWRRIEIPDCTLQQLHFYIQDAMGWEDHHLHQFIVGKDRFLPVSACDGDDYDESSACLSDIIPERSRKFRFKYEYDFGDGWMHQIAVERRAPPEKGIKYPRCLAGQRACPLEDCGGPWRYMLLLEAIADPEHELHAQYMEWCGEIDAEAFDCEQATRDLRRK